MKQIWIAAVAALALAACGQSAEKAAAPAQAELTATSANIAAAVAETRRPQADRDRDAARHPAETLAFAEIRPGAKVGEIGGVSRRKVVYANNRMPLPQQVIAEMRAQKPGCASDKDFL